MRFLVLYRKHWKGLPLVTFVVLGKWIFVGFFFFFQRDRKEGERSQPEDNLNYHPCNIVLCTCHFYMVLEAQTQALACKTNGLLVEPCLSLFFVLFVF